MFFVGLLLGAIIAFGIISVFIAGEDNVDARQIYKDGMRDFARRLKTKVQKPEYPWEDFFICGSDIDELLKEMESEY